MSRYHENVVWQSEDGTWSRGFYAFSHNECDSDCDDETHEWCAEFDHDSFEWVSTGHATEDAAHAAWDGSNPGGTDGGGTWANEATRGYIEHLDDLAAQTYERARESASKATGHGGMYSGLNGFTSNRSPSYWGYQGPARQRTLKAIAQQRNALEKAAYGHKLGGYANLPDERIQPLTAQIAECLKTATDDEKRAYLTIQQQRRDGLQQMLDKHREHRAEQARMNSRLNYGYRHDPQAGQRQRANDEAEAAAEKHIAAIGTTRAKQEAEFFPPAPAPKKTAPVKKTAAKKPPTKPAPKKTFAKAPAPKKTAPVAAPAGRGKTTAKTNAGSFKSHTTAEATDIDLVASQADPWGDIPQH